jgi:hypothetical protein
MVDNAKNYPAPVSISFTTLVINGTAIIGSSPFAILPTGLYEAVIDGVTVRFAVAGRYVASPPPPHVVDLPRISLVGIEVGQNAITGNVISRATPIPPPVVGDRYIVPVGDPIGYENQIAVGVAGPAWSFHIPQAGEIEAVLDESANYIWTGAEWLVLPPETGRELSLWRGAQASLADSHIYDHSQNAYPLFNLPVYSVVFYSEQPCYVTLTVDDTEIGKVAAAVGRNRFNGVSFTRGQHKIEITAGVEP